MNEKLLTSNEYFNLTYLPAKNPNGLAVFHVGGILPYSDKIFRFLPEINFYERFLENGISIYAMELKGNKFNIPNYNTIKLEYILQTINEFSKIAFIHNQKRKMILEGYCGLGIQSLSYLTCYPEEADERFSLLSLFVAPIDGKQCGILSEAMDSIPNYLIEIGYFISKIIGEVPFIKTQTTQDLALNSIIPKTFLGLYHYGWKNEKYHIQDLWNKELLLDQKKELAGTYWISPFNGYLYPIPLDLAKFYTRLYKQGISEDGILPWKINNQNLDLKTILNKTTIKIIGFYGKKDKLVPDHTAQILKKTLDYRYKHIVHEDAGHISYILSPELWNSNQRAFCLNFYIYIRFLSWNHLYEKKRIVIKKIIFIIMVISISL